MIKEAMPQKDAVNSAVLELQQAYIAAVDFTKEINEQPVEGEKTAVAVSEEKLRHHIKSYEKYFNSLVNGSDSSAQAV